MTSDIKRLGILAEGFAEWGGGIDFLRLVADSLHAADPDVELHLLMPANGPRTVALRTLRAIKRGFLNSVLQRNIVVPRRPNHAHLAELVHASDNRIKGHDVDAGSSEIAKAARRLQLDAVLPAINPLYVGTQLPWLGYLYDYQHEHLPHLFAAWEIEARRRNFSTMLNTARSVIVNARAVEQDIYRFHPGHKAKVIALPIAAAPSLKWLGLKQPPVDKYGITGPYFIVCNQFWQHKDHLTIWRAFARLGSEFADFQLVCTGDTHDYRNPLHLSQLEEEAGRLGISQRIHILGMIPKADQIALMRGSTAVIQATWNEGGPGGGAVFDAVALGVPSIVSDIAVNLELEEPTVRFFRKGDPDDLAAAMRQRIQVSAPSYSDAELIEKGRARRAMAGRTLLDALNDLRA